MNELSIIRKNGVDVIDSREVAEAIGKEHRHLIRDIRNYVEILEKSIEPKIGLNENPEESNESNCGSVEKSTAGDFSPSDFFIPSEYKDSIGRTLPCYLLTKKGCDMVANKMTGEKGVLFTAAYVTAFEKMRETVTSPAMIPGLSPQTQALINMELRQNKLEAEQQATKSVVMNTLNTFAAPPTDEERWRDEMNRRVRRVRPELPHHHRRDVRRAGASRPCQSRHPAEKSP